MTHMTHAHVSKNQTALLLVLVAGVSLLGVLIAVNRSSVSSVSGLLQSVSTSAEAQSENLSPDVSGALKSKDYAKALSLAKGDDRQAVLKALSAEGDSQVLRETLIDIRINERDAAVEVAIVHRLYEIAIRTMKSKDTTNFVICYGYLRTRAGAQRFLDDRAEFKDRQKR
jgi:hypothetical protein